MCYFRGAARRRWVRSTRGVVTRDFTITSSPSLVARSFPLAWELASPDVVVGARFAPRDAALTRLLGPMSSVRLT